jgi:hypothetical protein
MSSKQPVHHCHNCGTQLQNGNICFDNGAFYCTEACRSAFKARPAADQIFDKCKRCDKQQKKEYLDKWSGLCGPDRTKSSCYLSCFEKVQVEKKATDRKHTQEIMASCVVASPFGPIGTGWIIPNWTIKH